MELPRWATGNFEMESVEEIKQLFVLLDENRSGELSSDEIAKLTESIGMGKGATKEMMKMLDADQSGAVDFDEFMHGMVFFLELRLDQKLHRNIPSKRRVEPELNVLLWAAQV